MTEIFGMVLEDGPYAGEYIAPRKISWPLPDRVKALNHSSGHYKKYNESKGTAKSGEVRGARYKWVEEPF